MSTTEPAMSALIERDGAAIVGRVVNGVIENADIWIAVARYIYTRLTERSALEVDDLSRHRMMCDLYSACTQPTTNAATASIPREWGLEEGRPLYTSSFRTQNASLKQQIIAFDKCSNNLKKQIVGIVSSIARLFESLSKRIDFPFRDRYREDGYECMFLTELAMWFVVELPRYPITEKATGDMVKRRIKYCQDIQERVLIYRNDLTISNPKDTLTSIIRELKIMSNYLTRAHEAANFSQMIQTIDNLVIDQVANSFNILHLMMDGVNEDEFQVGNFLAPGIGKKTKVDVLRNKLLGKWIIETLTAAGYESNYSGSRNSDH